jgi:hypothetical protein
MSRMSGIPFDVNPQIRTALVQLSILMDDYHYSQHAKERILAYTALHGTPSLCPELDVEDEADAELIFVAELPAIPYDSPAWDDDGSVILDMPMLWTGTHPYPLMDPSEPDEATLISHEASDGAVVAAKMIESGVLPPLSGGSPEPYIPSKEDLQDLADWLEQLDRERDIAEMRRWYARHDLSEFNDSIRNGE